MRYPKHGQHKHAKSRYRVQNWADYEAGLQKRGALTVWLSKAALDAWCAPASGRPGGQRTYSDLAIGAGQVHDPHLERGVRQDTCSCPRDGVPAPARWMKMNARNAPALTGRVMDHRPEDIGIANHTGWEEYWEGSEGQPKR